MLTHQEVGATSRGAIAYRTSQSLFRKQIIRYLRCKYNTSFNLKSASNLMMMCLVWCPETHRCLTIVTECIAHRVGHTISSGYIKRRVSWDQSPAKLVEMHPLSYSIHLMERPLLTTGGDAARTDGLASERELSIIHVGNQRAARATGSIRWTSRPTIYLRV